MSVPATEVARLPARVRRRDGSKALFDNNRILSAIRRAGELEATPAEGTTYRFAKEDRKHSPGILQAGSEEAPYYTNSSQLPVGFTDDPFEALERQDDLQRKYTGGLCCTCICRSRYPAARQASDRSTPSGNIS